MARKANVSFATFKKNVTRHMRGDHCAVKSGIAEQAKKLKELTSKNMSWKNWLEEERKNPDLNLEEIDWPTNLSAAMSTMLQGKGDKDRAAAVYYILHYHLDKPEHALAVDEISFGNKTYLAKFDEPVFIELVDQDQFTHETVPFEHPSYVSQADLRADDVDEAVWLNPHNHHSIPLKGRDTEWKLLESFLDAPDPFLIWALIGPSGAGKTRLISQFMKSYVASETQKDWDAGFVKSRSIEVWCEGNWRPSRNTLIIIDYTFNYGEVMKTIAEFCQRLPVGSSKVRLLIVDHIYPDDLTTDPFWQNFFPDRHELHLSRDNPRSKRRFLYRDKPIYIAPEVEDSELLKHVIVAAANAGGGNSYASNDDLIARAERLLHKMGETAANPGAIKYPLFAALMGQALRTKQSDAEYWTRRDLIDNYFSRKHRLPWLNDPRNINKDTELGKWVGAIVAVATLARRVRRRYVGSSLPEEYRGRYIKENIDTILSQVENIVSFRDNETIRPLEPDILGENFLIKYFSVIEKDSIIRSHFFDMLREAQGIGQINDTVNNFFEVIHRLIRNLSNDNQHDHNVQLSWELLRIFLSCVIKYEDGLFVFPTNVLAIIASRYLFNAGKEIEAKDLLSVVSIDAGLPDELSINQSLAFDAIFYYFESDYSDKAEHYHSTIIPWALSLYNSGRWRKFRDIDLAVFFGGTRLYSRLLEGNPSLANELNGDGKNLLMTASELGQIEMLKEAFSINKNLEEKSLFENYTALMFAAENNNVQEIEFLITNGALVDNVTDDYDAFLFFNDDMIHPKDFLTNSINLDFNLRIRDVGHTALMVASAAGSLEAVSFLLKKNANPNAKTTDTQKTALHFASNAGHEKIVELLLAEGAEIDHATSDMGWTALMFASQYGHEEVVKALIQNKCNRFLKTKSAPIFIRCGYTARMLAEQFGHEQLLHLYDN